MSNENNKKIALIIAFRDFKDQECFVPHKILKQAGVEVEIVSNKKGLALGSEGGELEATRAIDDLDVEEYDGLFFIGGPGALEHLDNEKSYHISRQAFQAGKLVGAICISPLILAKAGVLKDKKATVWSNSLNKGPVRILESKGAQFVDSKVVKDGRVITANGPGAASQFGQKILDSLA